MDRITKFRASILLGIFAFIVSFFGVRLYMAQVANAELIVDSGTRFTYEDRIRAARGDILDRNGNVLVSNRASYNLTFTNFVINSADDRNEQLLKLVTLCADRGIEYIDHFPITMERPYEYTLTEYSLGWQNYFLTFSRHMGIDSDTSANLYMKLLRSALSIPDEWTDEQARRVIGVRYEIALRNDLGKDLAAYNFIEDVKEEDLAAILELNVPGLSVKYSTVREYHTSYAAHILGYVAPMSADNWEEFKDKPGYAQDAQIGHEGFEYAFEEELHGVDGWKTVTVDKYGNILEEYYTQEPITGNNVETTIDLNLQIVAEDSLRETIEMMQSGTDSNIKEDSVEVEGMAVVVMAVKTGEILACASYPTYNPSEFHDVYNDLVTDPLRPMVNRAINQAYPPGSTYKMVTTIAAIDAGVIGRYTQIEDKGKYTEYEKDKFVVECLVYTKQKVTHGVLTVDQALEVSCNYFFYWLGDHLRTETIDKVGKGMGLGEPTGVEVPEVIGQRANEETKRKNHTGYDADWYVGDKIPAAIGQSEHRYTPLQMCVYACTLANRGTRYAATFLKRVVSSDYTSLIRENSPTVMSTYPISDDAYWAYMEGMRRVTQEKDGTAYKYFRFYNTVSVAAKTGTADMDGQPTANGAFICFAPIEDPEIAIVIYGEKAAHGSSLSYIARDIMNAYFAQDEVSDVVNFENRLG